MIFMQNTKGLPLPKLPDEREPEAQAKRSVVDMQLFPRSDDQANGGLPPI